MPIKVFLVDGREIVRQGIKVMLANNDRVILVGEASNENDALEKLKIIKPDVVLMDINASMQDVLKFTSAIKKVHPGIRILILTTHEYESSLIKLLHADADGYVFKDTSKDELVFAIEKVNEEGSYMKPGFILDVLDKYKSQSETNLQPVHNITEREQQVLELIAQGLTNIEMARKLFTSVRTIETRRKKLLEKTGTINTATLIRFAVLNGMIK